jgi:protein-S-isoprenylcysteine O-methyltransferase
MARLSASSSANGHATAPTARPRTAVRQDDDPEHEHEDAPKPETTSSSTPTKIPPYDPSLLPNGSRSLTSIAQQSFWLGFTLALCILLTIYWTLFAYHPVWRLPAFFLCLSIFHYLEFYITAKYNLPVVRASSFLLFTNGKAYNIAHTVATAEILLSTLVLPETYRELLVYPPWTLAAGVALILLGQGVRSIAMKQAGTNFNHVPVQTRSDDHELVTHGVYAWLRHPSYFGFFWWALGTQVLVGNKVSLVGYAIALWTFFHRRIKSK